MYGGSTKPLIQIAEEVKRTVIGQDATVDWLCAFADSAAERSRLIVEEGVSPLELPSMGSALLAGPTASGKSHLVKTFARVAELHCHSIDAGAISAEGYRGASFSDHWYQVAEFLDHNPGMNALVLIDEIDKLMGQVEREGSAKFDLLKPLEGGILEGFTRTESGDMPYRLNCDRCIFVLAGAFTGIEDVIRKRLGISDGGVLGFGAPSTSHEPQTEDDLRELLTLDDLEEWGLPREVIGRFSTVRFISALGEEALRTIVRRNKVAEFRRQLAPVSFAIDDGAEDLIVRNALKAHYGARSINQQLNNVYCGPLRFELSAGGVSSVTIVADGEHLDYRLEHGDAAPASREPGSASREERLVARSAYSLINDVRLALDAGLGDLDPRQTLGTSSAEYAAALLASRGIANADDYSLAEITLLNALYCVLRDWFGAEDFTPGGMRTLLSMADLEKPGYSPLDLLFRQIEAGDRYIEDPLAAPDSRTGGRPYSWQPTNLRRHDGVCPADTHGLAPSQDKALGYYVEFGDYPYKSRAAAIASLAFRLL